MNSQAIYDNLTDFPNAVDADIYNVARRVYIDHRTEYHLQHPAGCDLDILSYENGQLINFIKAYPADPLAAADAFWRAIRAEAKILAEDDADSVDADYDTIMSFAVEQQ